MSDLSNEPKMEENLVRGFYMLLYLGFVYVAGFVLFIVIGASFIITLISGELNTNLQDLGRRMSLYVGQCLQFLTYNSNDKPYPFSDWPE